jgi:tRNA G18 (ribose-2'-O)-methylase SpoU
MGLRGLRKRQRIDRLKALGRFERQRRANMLATPGIHDFIVVLDHLKPEFNIGKIFRSADAFGAHEVHLVGVTFFDPAPAMGSFKWVPARFHETFGCCHETLRRRGYTLFAVEPAGTTALPGARLPARSAFVFGHEEFGLSFDKSDYAGLRSLSIPQFGKVQSLNVSIAASLVMYEYLKQHGTAYADRPGPDAAPGN